MQAAQAKQRDMATRAEERKAAQATKQPPGGGFTRMTGMVAPDAFRGWGSP